MILEVAIGERVRSVSVVRKGALLHVALDGRVHVVDARRINEATLSLLVHAGTEGTPVRSIEAAFAAHAVAGDFDVHVAGRTVPVQVRLPGAFRRQTKDAGGAPGSGPQRVVSPMPGKIVRVLVKAGDQVTARQGLVVVEAMKMENELRAARDGRVRELSVAQGQSVDAGTVLLVVD
jgi:biotin carboxyl carrier protein